jgi:hypothetical protein
MKTVEFQSRILADLKRELITGRIELERLSDIASAALELSNTHPKGIERQDILDFARRFPECRFEMTNELKREESLADEAAASELRSLIKKREYE